MSNAKTRAVIVGVGQVRNRPGLDAAEWKPEEPARLMATALSRAAADAGRPRLLAEADFVGCIPPMAWSYDDLPGRVAELVGAQPREKLEPPGGGEGPILLLDDVANRICDGELEIALLAGSEAVYSRRRARAENRKLDWTPGGDGFPRFLLGMKPFANALEVRHGVRQPVDMYPLYENALRARAGRTIEAHQRHVSELMARYSEVAALNPFSWFPEPRSAEQIRTVSAKNRWIGFPYPKLVNALMEVDQGAAAIVMSERRADSLGIAREKRVAFLGGASANDGWSAAERSDLASSPAMAAIARAAQSRAGLGVADVDLFDFYSCFPCVVEFALDALGLSPADPRGPTQTGGLAHHGGPGNNYAMHGLANTVLRIRGGRGKVGWVTGLGMSATKHAWAVISNDPKRIAASDGRAERVSLPTESFQGPKLVDAPSGPAQVESYTVMFDRENRPERSVLYLRLPDGRRTVAHGEPTPELFRLLLEVEGVGLRGTVTAGQGDAPNVFALR
ncbi:MAG: acetyl-CoA acetyltransferase [Myxococcota bacterium]